MNSGPGLQDLNSISIAKYSCKTVYLPINVIILSSLLSLVFFSPVAAVSCAPVGGIRKSEAESFN